MTWRGADSEERWDERQFRPQFSDAADEPALDEADFPVTGELADPASLPAHWSISSDFVARTFARVRDDQARIRAEADAVESIQLPRALLAAYVPPTPSPDFAANTLARLRATPTGSVDQLLTRYATPRVSPDFVERTLAALRADRATGRRPAEHQPVPAAILPFRRARLLRVAAAAALVLAVVVFFVTRRGAAVPDAVPSAFPDLFVSLQDGSPTRISTAFARLDDRVDGGLRLEPVDPLLLLVADGGTNR